MSKQVMDNLIQENDISQCEQRSGIRGQDRFTVNLIEADEENLDVTRGTIPQKPQNRGVFQWIGERIKTILIIIVVILVIGFIVVYLYKRKQKKTQDEISRLKQKINNSQFKNKVDEETPDQQNININSQQISKDEMVKKAAEIASQLNKEDSEDEQQPVTKEVDDQKTLQVIQEVNESIEKSIQDDSNKSVKQQADKINSSDELEISDNDSNKSIEF